MKQENQDWVTKGMTCTAQQLKNEQQNHQDPIKDHFTDKHSITRWGKSNILLYVGTISARQRNFIEAELSNSVKQVEPWQEDLWSLEQF